MRFLPNKLQLDVLRRHVGPFVFCFFTIMFLLLMQFLILYIDRLIGKGLPLSIIVELILTNLAYMVVLAAPMATLVACLMAFGKFTELNELTALRAAGINPIHVIKPVLAVAAILSVLLIWFSNDVLPESNQRARALFIDIRVKKPGFDLQENEFYDGIEGYTFLVKRIPAESDSLYDVTLFQEPSARQKKAIIKAKRGFLKSVNEQTLSLYLYDGQVIRFINRPRDGTSNKVLEETNFRRHRISFDLSEMAFSRSTPDSKSRNDRTMDIAAMMAVADTLGAEIDTELQRVLEQKTFDVGPTSVVQPLDDQPQYGSLEGANADSSLQTPYKSRYHVLNMLATERQQDDLYNFSLRRLRDYRSSYDNLKVNADWRQGRIAQYWVEIHKKISLPLACLVFVLVGAPIGMFTKKGNLGYAALISTVFLTFFWISIIQGEKLADRHFISPFTGMWFSNILLSIVGVIMLLHLCTSWRISNLWTNRD